MTDQREQISMNRSGGESGMSLVEVLVAMTVAGVVMLAAATLLRAGLDPIQNAGFRAREAVQLYETQRMLTRDANGLSQSSVSWELRPDPTGRGYELVRSEYVNGQWYLRVMLDGVTQVDATTGRLQLRSGAQRWVDITARGLKEP
jgi:prepilin-type N-terminal cleavage/methylation domain-containing protein